MATDTAERAFIQEVVTTATQAGARPETLLDLLTRAYVLKDAGRWTNTLTFLEALRKEAPSFFAGSATRPASEATPIPKAPGVTTRVGPKTLGISRKDASNAQLYRQARAQATALGWDLVIDPGGGSQPLEPMRPVTPRD